jgi:hypothetical protein
MSQFIHARCNQAIARQVADEIEGIHILDVQILGDIVIPENALALRAETAQAQTEYWREYFFQEECQRNQALIQEIQQSSIR